MQKMPDVELLAPPRFNWPLSAGLWILTGLAISALPAGHPAPGHGTLSAYALPAVIVGFAIVLQYLMAADRDITLSVEGIRKGKGRRAVFIPWLGASLHHDRDRNRFVITSKGKRIVVRSSNFDDPYRFQEIMSHLRLVVYGQAWRRNRQADKMTTPLHGLSAQDRREFLAYRGDGFLANVFWPYLAPPVLCLCVAYVVFIEVVLHQAALGPDVTAFVHVILKTCPLLFYWPWVLVYIPIACVVAVVIVFRGLPLFLARRHLKALRLRWLQQFDRPQMISISPIGLVCRETDGQRFLPWDDVYRISQTRGLILFHLVPDLRLSIILPRRAFATAHDAADFVARAEDFKRAARNMPNLVEPVSFWEIA
jgi:hypothetical protein